MEKTEGFNCYLKTFDQKNSFELHDLSFNRWVRMHNQAEENLKGTVMQIEKALINDR